MYITCDFHCFIGRSINVKSAGLVGRQGPQSKQPFMVAFFKASEVLFRSVRAANNKRKNQNRNKSSSHQESSRMPSVGGKMKLCFTSPCLQELWAPAQMQWCLSSLTRHCSLAELSETVPALFLPAPIALLKPLLLCWLWAWSTFCELVHLHVWLNFICIWGVGRKKCTADSLVSFADLEHSYFWGRWRRGMHVFLLKILGFVNLLTFIKALWISVYNCFVCLFVFEYWKVFWYSV